MVKLKRSLTLLLFLTVLLPVSAYSQEEKVKIVTEKFDFDTDSDLNDYLKEKQKESSKKNKVDVEMLGLDDVAPKATNTKKEEAPPVAIDNIVKDEDEKPEKIEAELPIANSLPVVKIEAKNENEEVKKDDEPKQENDKAKAPINSKENKPEADVADEKPSKNGIFGKIKSFINKKTDHEKKKITIKLGKEEEKKVEEGKKTEQELENERLERLAKEKEERLDRLRKKYLLKIQSKEDNIEEEDSKFIVPQKKELSWSDSFYKTVDMAPPIISRSRSEDNSHIPIIPTFRERIDGLFSTIKSDDISAFNNFYKKIAIPDLRNEKGDTILTYALLLKRHSVVLSILSKGADPDLPNALGHTPLDIAIESLDLKSVKILIDNHVDIGYIDKYNRTYLMLAARKGYLPVVQLLVESGADVNKADSYGRTALNIAYRHKKEVVAKYLLKNGAKTWIEKPYDKGNQELIKELENRWKTPVFNSQ